MGGQASRLQAELEETKARLATAEESAAAAQTELRKRQADHEASLLERDTAIARAASECAQQLEAKQQEVTKVTKQREIVEELRRADALLVKRLTSAMMRKQAGGEQAGVQVGSDGIVDGAMAAQLAVAADSEVQLRQVLQRTTLSLQATEEQLSQQRQLEQTDLRRELCDTLWLPQLCDTSISLRSPRLMVLGGLRLPRQPSATQRASGVCGGVGVLRSFGNVSRSQGSWAAVGGSMLWDVRERDVAALRFATCMQPEPGKQLAASFDHNGMLNGSVKGSIDAFSVRILGSVDLNRQRRSGASVEIAYDVE